MPIKVPSAQEEPLRLLAQQSEDRRALLAALRAAKGLIDPSELISAVVKESKLKEELVSSWVRMLLSMYLGAAESHAVFADEVCAIVEHLIRDPAERDVVDWSGFKADLEALLACDESLGVTAKALSVRSEYAAIYCRARIVTDVRPIFGPDPTTAPLAAVIVHTLRITYHDGDSHKDFYVALDAGDLRQMRELAERASKKEASLKAEIVRTRMRYLEPEVR